ncbi:MAG: hypothetical protein ACLGPL_01905 [Acidobacteriota bacterium]
MNTAEANQVMQEANKIIEDFSVRQYAVYTLFYGIQIALCFWVSLSLLK